MELILERKSEADQTVQIPVPGGAFAMTPPIQEDYWAYRVRLSETQAIVGFPKFGTIGIGFAQEEDWNTNLPYTCATDEIYNHIKVNKGEAHITKAQCLEAIRLVQEAATADREAG